ncbi:MAG TPA: flagellar export chaperone FliS [Clostridiaceae bacterium]|nr:flagellar export chaperone FliS [Clostridiaceae bacterium]
MALSKAYDRYKENSVYTSTPEELTFMLYNGMVRFILQAQLALEEKDVQKANVSIIRAQDIVLYLQNTLDMKYDISKNLASIYDYLYRRLIDANIHKDKEILNEVLGFAKDLRDTWSQAMKLAKQQGKAHQTPADGQ